MKQVLPSCLGSKAADSRAGPAMELSETVPTKPIAQPILSLSIYLDLLILVSALVERGPPELLVPLPPRARDQDASALVLPPGVLRPIGILGTEKSVVK